MKKLLIVTSHPDDESFCCGGTIAKYVENGWEVELICLTNGEKGDSGEYINLSKEDLGKIRQAELSEASKVLGISKLTLLEYPDTGLNKATPGDIEDKLFNLFIEAVPDVVITFDTNGITNHSDHIRTCYTTTFTFQKYALWVEDNLLNQIKDNPEVLPKLYYMTMPENTIKFLKSIKALPNMSFGKPWVGTADKAITTVIDISEFKENKIKAINCHKSQVKDINLYLSQSDANPFLKQEYYVLRMHGQKEIFMGKNDSVDSEL